MGSVGCRSEAFARSPASTPLCFGSLVDPPKIHWQDLKKEQYSGLLSRRREALCSGSGWVVAVRTRVSDVNNYGIKVAAS